MDRAWADELIEKLGQRYRLGPGNGSAFELLYRSGKAEFRPTRIMIGGGESGREMALSVDVRIPKEHPKEASERLVAAAEKTAFGARGFTRVSDEHAEQVNQHGEAAGSVRTLGYVRAPSGAAEGAAAVRAIVESIEIPIIVGIHEPHDLVARDPPPESPRPRHHHEPLDKLSFDLEGGMLRSLTVEIDPNDRTLRVNERKLVASKQLGETVKLAHVSKLGVKTSAGRASLLAIKRDGTRIELASGKATPDFVQTCARLAKAAMIPIEDL